MTEVATTCDECGGPIAYNVTAYAVPTGEMVDVAPVVRLLCVDCYRGCYPAGSAA